MNDKPINRKTVHFDLGGRYEAIKRAVEIVKKTGRAADLIICRDIIGEHTGDTDCFCDPKVIRINEKGELVNGM